MHHISLALTLLPQQCRLINATEGFRLEVCSGCLWLTRPGDTVDRFLTAGAVMELHEAGVLIQSDRLPGAAGGVVACYVLVPLVASGASQYRQWFKRFVHTMSETFKPKDGKNLLSPFLETPPECAAYQVE
jgi:hypothetical protein